MSNPGNTINLKAFSKIAKLCLILLKIVRKP